MSWIGSFFHVYSSFLLTWSIDSFGMLVFQESPETTICDKGYNYVYRWFNMLMHKGTWFPD